MATQRLIAAVVAAVCARNAAADPSGAFLPPQAGVYAANADLVPPWNASSADECMQACLDYNARWAARHLAEGWEPTPGVLNQTCVHANVCALNATAVRCGIGGYSRTYELAAGDCSYYVKIQPRNDTSITPAIQYALTVPTGNVTLHGGVLWAAFQTNIQYLLNTYTVDDILYNFRVRAGITPPPGSHCIGWDCTPDWVEGSIAGLFLMGAGGILRWYEHPQLRQMMDDVVQGIANCSQPNGYIMAFAEDTLPTDEHPDYTSSWVTHGLLEAHIAGNPLALDLIRRHTDWFNNCTYLPFFLPPDGGNPPYQTPAGPPPPGWDGVNNTGSGSKTGHTIYLIDQGIIHNTRMALSGAGRQADIDVVQRLYQEDWWLEYLASGNLSSIWQKQWFPHNYLVTAFEAYMDMYILTGESLYYDAVTSAWSMFRTHFMHVGGSVAINEAQYYAPGSYYLTAQDADLPHRDAFRHSHGVQDHHHGAPHGHAGHDHGKPHSSHASTDSEMTTPRHLQNDWGKWPTGEMCGAVFWTKLNQRLHRLQPDVETFVAEMEREIFNEGLGHQGINGTGIRYFSNLNGVKEEPGHVGTCCEGQGTRLYGSLHEYLYSYSTTGVTIDIFAPSTITFVFNGVAVNLTVITDFPYGDGSVNITVAVASSVNMDVALRIPSWISTSTVPVLQDGVATWNGQRGTYLHLTQKWNAGTTAISVVFPRVLEPMLYTGFTQISGYQRYAFVFGPILLAAQGGGWNSSIACINIDGVDPTTPSSWLAPSADSNSLHFDVTAGPAAGAVTFIPHMEVQAQQFSVYPAFPTA